MAWELIIQSPSTERTYVQVKPGKTTLGRKSQNDIVIEDEAASREHAVLEFDRASNRLIIWDAGSTNGTFVNGKKIFKAQNLEHTDQMRIGAHLITVISKETASLVEPKARRSGQPANYNELLLHSVDNYTVLLLDFSKQLSKTQSLSEAQTSISEFLGKMLNADKCKVVLAEHFDDLIVEFGSRKITGSRYTDTVPCHHFQQFEYCPAQGGYCLAGSFPGIDRPEYGRRDLCHKKR